MSGSFLAHLVALSAAFVVGVCVARASHHGHDDCDRAHSSDRVHRAREKASRSSRRNVRIYLVRHAQSSGNARDQTIGNHYHGRSIHFPLSNEGKLQASALGRRWKTENLTFERVFASEALRAQETARLVAAELGSDVRVEHVLTKFQPRYTGICEINMGSWTGRKQSDVLTPEIVAARDRDAWTFRPPGNCEENMPGESYRDAEERFLNFLEDVVLAPKGGDEKSSEVPNVAVFSHHAAIRAVLRVVLEASPRMLSPKLDLHNTSVTILQYHTKPGRMGGWTLVGINDASHLSSLR